MANIRTDSQSLYYKLRMEGKSDAEAQEEVAGIEADEMEIFEERKLSNYLDSLEE